MAVVTETFTGCSTIWALPEVSAVRTALTVAVPGWLPVWKVVLAFPLASVLTVMMGAPPVKVPRLVSRVTAIPEMVMSVAPSRSWATTLEVCPMPVVSVAGVAESPSERRETVTVRGCEVLEEVAAVTPAAVEASAVSAMSFTVARPLESELMVRVLVGQALRQCAVVVKVIGTPAVGFGVPLTMSWALTSVESPTFT